MGIENTGLLIPLCFDNACSLLIGAPLNNLISVKHFSEGSSIILNSTPAFVANWVTADDESLIHDNLS